MIRMPTGRFGRSDASSSNRHLDTVVSTVWAFWNHNCTTQEGTAWPAGLPSGKA